MRDTDKPWPEQAMRRLTQAHVDVQDLVIPLKDLPHTMRRVERNIALKQKGRSS